MNFSRFFIDRPIFAAVLSIIIFAAGLIALPLLPIGEYPDVVPPSVLVQTTYPGANPKTIAETVANPLEEAINGVEDMMYMKSVASSEGAMLLTVTFRPGTNPDDAAVKVQNRVAQALPRLPEDVRRQGVTTQKRSPTFLITVQLTSPDGRYDAQYLRNYARIHMRDSLTRIPGVADVVFEGAGEYAMRAWLDPERIAARGLTASDILRAMREQNVQVSAGQLGAAPMPAGDFVTLLNTQGRLQTEEQFGSIVVKSGRDGELVKLADVARIELGAVDYARRSLVNGHEAVGMAVYQAPGANALEVRDEVVARMASMAKRLPPGITFEPGYDTTIFVRDSVRAVTSTLFEAVALVVIVVLLFLQTWRASLIPLIAVPVSIIGTFAALYILGFSINTLTLFGLVLAIGIVVDDAIVVVENVERYIERGLTPLAAAHTAMREVSGPIVAIALVLCAVFVPMAFLSGVTGEFYKQFAVTIAISTVISAINSLTLSPALAARLLKHHSAPKDMLTRKMEHALGWLFRPFNRFFEKSSRRYHAGISKILGRRGVALVVYVALLATTGVMFKLVPGGFMPVQDKLFLITTVKLPEGASIERTDRLVKRITAHANGAEGVLRTISFTGMNVFQGINTPNMGAVYVQLKAKTDRSLTAEQIVANLNKEWSTYTEGQAFTFMPSPIQGLGNGNGYQLFIEDRENQGYAALQDAVQTMRSAIAATPGLSMPVTSYQVNVPQFDVEVDREKAKAQGVALTDIYETLQTYLGSAYVNDFTRFGRTWQVVVQADGQFRKSVQDVANLRTRNDRGEMVPIGTMVDIRQSFGPDPVLRYNGYPAADLLGESNPAFFSSAQTMEVLTDLAARVLPAGMSFEWAEMSYQQATQSNSAIIIFPVAVMLVFLVLAALYESWTLPLAVVLIVPLCMLSALVGVWITGGDNGIFVQVGLVVLMGLACKNAILIVEFARELELHGKGVVEAALEACRLRLRPIVMTSIAFIAGTIPLVVSTGAGAEVRSVMGITVFAGMLGTTVFGLLLTPVFYVAMRKLSGRALVSHEGDRPEDPSTDSQ
ncbi:efflux RND transporter permease subunit [Xanthomonas citri]|uniref:efflux RND transporter permease subunit n=1 Tax=Xanthomonas citri TaxID=346 RepID=UPI0018859DF7|nr:multidrug efflux RND transporter permease subunit [Xanthomonas citri]QOY21862.1 efflux RND transporter permease subunit [Xanthomonas citri]QQK68004.1 efflux RND transporter permease subunit [Xanthomonas citri]